MAPLSMQLITAFLAASLSTVVEAQTPSFKGFTQGIYIPFSNKGSNYANSPTLKFKHGKTSYDTTMDTGSSNVLLPAANVVGYDAKNCDFGYEFLSSSKRLYQGCWVKDSEIILMKDDKTALATATVPILAVATEVICPWYSGTSGQCPNKPASATTTSSVIPTPDISYLGVGFGRERDGEIGGTPDYNTLLNLASLGKDGKAIKKHAYKAGYLIGKNGVHVGLTEKNTKGDWKYLKLQKQTAYGNDPRDWQQAPMCISINGSPCQTGNVLVDTGIQQMYIDVIPETGLNYTTANVTNPSRKDTMVKALSHGTDVQIFFPDDKNPVGYYNFTVGENKNPAEPLNAIPIMKTTGTESDVFVNTGVHFLRDFEIMFDAADGYYGLRYIGGKNSGYAATV